MEVGSPRLIADAHNDLLLELAFRARAGERGNLFARHWLPQLERGGVGLQVCPVSAPLEADREAALRAAVEQVAAFEWATRENADRVVAVRSRADLEEVEHGRIGLVLSLEGAEPLGEDVGSAEAFFALGVRMVSLTWNTSNAFASGAAGTGGLTALGAELVDRLVELGVILDLVHASEATFWDVLERCGEAQLAVSHAACRALLDHPRNLSDEQLRALAERGGVLCLMQLPLVIDHEHPVIDRVVDHLDHAVSVMGIDRVGLGAELHPPGQSGAPARGLAHGHAAPRRHDARRRDRGSGRSGGLPAPRRRAARAWLRGGAARRGARRQPHRAASDSAPGATLTVSVRAWYRGLTPVLTGARP